jgi:hexosaminidase
MARPCTPVLVMVVALAALATGTASAQAEANATPTTIPALREWTGGTGDYTFSSSSRIVRDPATLTTTGEVFSDDLEARFGHRIAVVEDGARAGDIVLRLGSTDTALGDEGYALTVTDRVVISARTDAGAFYGTRTVLQLLKQRTTIPQGGARDWPLKRERGLMVDNGRKFFTPQWLSDHVKELAYLKLNYLHLHLTDNLGFRIESTTHPEYVSSEHLTKQQVRDLIALAARYKITVVPEFDAPGHMDTILAEHPNLKLVSNAGTVNHGFIDLSKPAAYALIKDIYDEYLPLFPSPYFHIGADEYVTDYNAYPQLLTYARANYGSTANAKDTYLGFVNWANGIVRAAGKTTRAWNDGLHGGSAVKVSADVVVEFWYNSGLSPQQHVDNGHLVSNESWNPTYYVLYNGSVGRPNTTWGYETWNTNIFQGNQTLNAATENRNLGSKIHVWCDFPAGETEAQIAAGIKDPLRMLAQHTWASPKLVSTWSAFTSVIAVVGRNPQWPSAAQPGNLAYGKPVSVSSTETPSFPAMNAVDGDYSSRWSSTYTDNEWITVDLGLTRQVGRVKLTWEAAYGKGYHIQSSVDGTAWTTLSTVTAGDGGTDELSGLSGSGRFIRVKGTARGTTYGYSLYEFEVYAPSPVVSGGTYLVAVSGKALDIPGGSAAIGTQLIVWTSHSGPNQRFTFTATYQGTYTVRNVGSGLCLDVSGGSTAADAKVIQWTCTGSPNQQWRVGPDGSVVAAHSGQVLTAGGLTDGSLVTQQADAGQPAQRWSFVTA